MQPATAAWHSLSRCCPHKVRSSSPADPPYVGPLPPVAPLPTVRAAACVCAPLAHCTVLNGAAQGCLQSSNRDTDPSL
ncbi:hypothetical protein JTE90_000576 [Oedothorax gibbosus]|uniref:Uncharacterized protein n=1 Tax=Oedothorax gibbosus TaxID=931172 RepID=A0AAV6VWK2_9ARAC|nr:hypothetical protein JTE90_000576 [Oedothorax gibbosus]